MPCLTFYQCKLCGREGSVQMITGQGQPLTLEQSQAENFSPLMVFDCRGFEPIGFSFGNGWKAESVSASFLTGNFFSYYYLLQ